MEELPSLPGANKAVTGSTSTSTFKGLFSWKRKGTSRSPELDHADDHHASINGKAIGRPQSQYKPSDGTMKSALKKSADHDDRERSNGRPRPTRPNRSPSSQQLEAIESWRRASYELSTAEDTPDQSPCYESNRSEESSIQPTRRPFARRTSSRPSPPILSNASPISSHFESRQRRDNVIPDGSLSGSENQFQHHFENQFEDVDVRNQRPSTPPPRTTASMSRVPPKSPMRATNSRSDSSMVLDDRPYSPNASWKSTDQDKDLSQGCVVVVPTGRTNRISRRQSSRCSTISSRRGSALISLNSMAALNQALDSICAEVQQSPNDSDVPMFNFIPPTPVANSDEFGHNRTSRTMDLGSPMILEDALELKQTPEDVSNVELELDPTLQDDLEESRDAVPELNMDSTAFRFGKASNRGHITRGSISSEQSSSSSVSYPSMSSISTSSSTESIPDLEEALGSMIRSLSGCLDDSSHDVDSMQATNAYLDKELASWASISHGVSGPVQGTGNDMAIGLGFGTGWEASPKIVITEQIVNVVQPLNTRRRDDSQSRSPVKDIEKTPVASNRSFNGCEQGIKQTPQEENEDQSRRSSATSSIMSAGMGCDTDTDSIMSDMDDLHTASIAQINGAASCLVFASPRTVELGSTPQMEYAAHLSSHYQRHPPYENDRPDITIGWAM